MESHEESAEPPDETTIAGVVQTDASDAIPGAAVAIYDPDTGARRTQTDAEGRFQVRGLDVNKVYRVSATADGMNEAVEEAVAPGRHNLTLVLSSLSSVRGEVVDGANASPITEFDVAYLEVVPASLAEWRLQALREGVPWERVSDASGRFVLDTVKSERPFAVAARAAGYGTEFVACAPIAPGASADGVVISLGPAARVTGVVLDPAGAPLAGATVSVGGSERTLVEAARSDANGRFSIDDAPAAPLVLRSVHSAYADAEATAAASPGAVVEVKLVHGEAGEIEGTVTAGEVPQPGQKVIVSARPGSAGAGKGGETTTDEQGRYRFGGLPAGEYDVIAMFTDDPANPDAAQTLTLPAQVEAGAVTIVNFPFSPASAVVSGRVTINGAPPAEAEVKGVIGTDAGEHYFSAVVDAAGQFRAQRLPAGAAFVEVTASRADGPPAKRTVTFSIRPGEHVVYDIAIDAQTAIVGEVTGLAEGETAEVLAVAQGQPVRAGNIEELMAIRQMAAAAISISDNGAFRLEGIEPGEYTVVAIAFNPDDDAGDPLDTLRVLTEPVQVREGDEAEVSFVFGG